MYSENLTPGERLYSIRQKLSLSQDAFAAELGLRRSAISLYENGRREISESILLLMQKVYNINPYYILNGREPMFIPLHKTEQSNMGQSFEALNSKDLLFLNSYICATPSQRAAIREKVNDLL